MPPTRKLFSPLIKTLMKRKAESSGWPEDAVSEVEKRKLLKEWKDLYGIELDPAAMSPNVGMRSLTKLFLVAFWGKFA